MRSDISVRRAASNFLYLIAPVATALAYLFTDVVPERRKRSLGGALAILGVIIVNTRGRN